MDLRIEGGRVLAGGRLEAVSVDVAGAAIAALDSGAGAARTLDAAGALVLPGIVDVHGDAFERQIMPRPGVSFPLAMALVDSDRQAVANGITTVFHGVTWSWEPGLRDGDNARRILEGIEALRPRLGADTRFHLRHETFNLDAEKQILDWLSAGRIDVLAFNDHLTTTLKSNNRAGKLQPMMARSGLSETEFMSVVEAKAARAAEVPAAITRLAVKAAACQVPLLSHDDTSVAQRQWFRALGCRVAEFPVTEATAKAAAAAGDDIVLGAPNVVRGGSHVGFVKASDMVARGLCSVLASDYYYPAPLAAAFRLVADRVAPIETAWLLVSETPARAIGLHDRGVIAAGRRADLVVVDAADGA
ncbi:MAG: alpha-D-ribose 1-methylphosphonate 5-triphosphate diphosphatase, partial [Alphaproteobacteria bacterium]|nr:alpha-D-ribose 1-methylphosphonate 5-triphosphate diphosphatase [Alphaproteobacteria bacterium]